MATWKLIIEYAGTRYSGWQTQSNTAKTIQGKLLEAAGELWRKPDLGGAGRTDAGVHATGQVAHLRVAERLTARQIEIGLNDRLPADISVVRVEPASDRFHARHDAVERIYLYQIATRRTALGKPFVWWIRDPLDVGGMIEAGSALRGSHDFRRFSDKRVGDESTRVSLERFEIRTEGDLILIRVGASHFLWKMVRKLVAALAEVGRGSMEPAQFQELVRKPGPPLQPTAPPSGLFLEAVRYRGETFERPLAALVPVRPPFGTGKGPAMKGETAC